MNAGKHRPRIGLMLLGLVVLALPALAFKTGVPLSLGIDPATIRQQGQADTAKVVATVTLKQPSPTLFLCQIRSRNGDQVSFPTIIFRKGDIKGKSEGVVHWKAVTREVRVRLSAYNTHAPDRQLAFTITLKPQPAPETDQP